MQCSLGISDFLEEISGLSHSVVFLYFFALITEEGFLISPCYSLEFCIHNHRKLANLITQTTALSNSMKVSHAVWKGLTECGPLEKGMANHFSILALRTP